MTVTALGEMIDLGDGHQWIQPELHSETDDYDAELGCYQGDQLVGVNTQMVRWKKEEEEEEEWRRRRGGREGEEEDDYDDDNDDEEEKDQLQSSFSS